MLPVVNCSDSNAFQENVLFQILAAAVVKKFLKKTSVTLLVQNSARKSTVQSAVSSILKKFSAFARHVGQRTQTDALPAPTKT